MADQFATDAGPQPLARYFDAAFKASERARRRGGLAGLTTGFSKIDELTAGLIGNCLWTIGGGTSSGKSSLALAIARNVVNAAGLDDRHRVYFASLEMGAIPLVHRLAAMATGLSLLDVTKGNLSPADWGRYADALNAEKAPAFLIHTDIRSRLTVSNIEAVLDKMRSEDGVSLAIIDYAQLVSPEQNQSNRERQVAEVIRGLKMLAQKFEIPIIGCAQLNRDAAKGGDAGLHHLRESGEIEQASDVVILINGTDDGSPNVMKMNLAKNKYGPKVPFLLAWNPVCTKFSTLTMREDLQAERRTGWAGYDD